MVTLLIVLATGLFIWLFIWWLVFNTSTSSDRPHCFLSFHRFKTLYNLNENRYCYCSNDYSDFSHLYLNKYPERDYLCAEVQIKFHFISFLFFLFWNMLRSIQEKRNEKNIGLELVLTRGKEDIEKIRARAEKEIREAERINNKVKENLEKSKYKHEIKLTLNEEEEMKWRGIKNDYLRGN